jgi:hypothetical protein
MLDNRDNAKWRMHVTLPKQEIIKNKGVNDGVRSLDPLNHDGDIRQIYAVACFEVHRLR